MILDLKPIFNIEGKSLDFNAKIESNVDEIGDITAIGNIKNDYGRVYFTAEISFDYKGLCDRCCDEIDKNHNFEIDYKFVRKLSERDDSNEIEIENYDFNLDEFVISEILISLDYKILCDENCRGICTECGINLNKNECECDKQEGEI